MELPPIGLMMKMEMGTVRLQNICHGTAYSLQKRDLYKEPFSVIGDHGTQGKTEEVRDVTRCSSQPQRPMQSICDLTPYRYNIIR